MNAEQLDLIEEHIARTVALELCPTRANQEALNSNREDIFKAFAPRPPLPVEQPAITATLSDWSIATHTGFMQFVGRIRNDKKGRFADGEIIRTSAVQRVDFETNLVVTRNSVYKLE